MKDKKEELIADEQKIQQMMQDFIDQNFKEKFIQKDFYLQSNPLIKIYTYIGIYQLKDDPRVEFMLQVNNVDNYANIANPVRGIKEYNTLVNTASVSDQTKEIVQSHFNPNYIRTYVFGGMDNYEIALFKQDEINPERIAYYFDLFKNISTTIDSTVAEVADRDYRIILNLYQDEYKIPIYQKDNRVTQNYESTGDYVLIARFEKGNAVDYELRLGYQSSLDKQFRKKIATRYQLKSPNSVRFESRAYLETHPECIDNNSVRREIRYYIPIYDEFREINAGRKHLKVNIFTGEISSDSSLQE